MFKIASNKSFLLKFCSIKQNDPRNTTNIIKFNIMYLKFPAKLAFTIINKKFLTSMLN